MMMKSDQVAILVDAGESDAHSCVCKCVVYRVLLLLAGTQQACHDECAKNEGGRSV